MPTQLQRLLDYLQENPTVSFSTRHILLGGTHIPAELTEKNSEIWYRNIFWLWKTEMASTVLLKNLTEKQGVGQPLLGKSIV